MFNETSAPAQKLQEERQHVQSAAMESFLDGLHSATDALTAISTRTPQVSTDTATPPPPTIHIAPSIEINLNGQQVIDGVNAVVIPYVDSSLDALKAEMMAWARLLAGPSRAQAAGADSVIG